MQPNRRKFIKDTICTAMGGVSVFSALGHMKLLQAAASQTSALTGYRALVCVFLYGGNDGFNTIVPYTQNAFTNFYGTSGVRPKLALDRTTLHPLTDTAASSADGIQYALHPSMSDLATLFNQMGSPVAIVANVGAIVRPTTQAQYKTGTFQVPPQLFSHADQAAYWQSAPPSNSPIYGWGGRLADLVASANPVDIPALTGLDGQDIFMRGQNVAGYVMSGGGVTTYGFPFDSGNANLTLPFNSLMAAGTQANALERTHATVVNHSRTTAGVVANAINAAPDFSSFFTNAGGLGTQLQTTAQLIYAAASNLPGYQNIHRQVFFVNVGGYDTHSGELDSHGSLASPGLLAELSAALAGFYNALNSKKVNNVPLSSMATAFTASDFGRTITSNVDGTDHGWGGHHFVVGGAVAGGKFYGNGVGFTAQSNLGVVMPSIHNPTNPNNNLNDSGDGIGRIIPTTAIDQYVATLARWFGISNTDVGTLFPNLPANFPGKFYLDFLGT